MSYFWSEDQLQFLKDNYPTEGPAYCAEKLGKSESAIRLKASKSGIKIGYWKYRDNTITHEQHEEALMEVESPFYPLDTYVNGNTTIRYSCAEGHIRTSRPRSLIFPGIVCAECAGRVNFDRNKSATLYFISFESDSETYYKLGVTNKSDVSQRFPGEWNRLKMKLLWSKPYTTGEEAEKIERELRNKFSHFLIDTGLLKCGNTETMSVYLEEKELEVL